MAIPSIAIPEPLNTTNFLYDGAGVVEELDNCGNVLAHYVQGGWLDEPLSQSRAGTASFYELDGNLSVTSLTSSLGSVANTYMSSAKSSSHHAA